MAVGAEDPGAIGVVQKNEIPRQFVQIGRDPLAVNAERGIAFALLHVSQDQVVGPVLLDDINHMTEKRWFARPIRHGAGRLPGPR